MNYKIILDEVKLKQFIDWLPELKKNETFYCCLFARSKYNTEFKIKSGQSQVKRFTADKDYLYDKIKQLECELGAYKLEGVSIPQEVLALYINPNPRDLSKAASEFLPKLTTIIVKHQEKKNPYSELMSQIQKTCVTNKPYVHFDFDGVSAVETIFYIKENDVINLNAVHILETKGGFHILVKVKDIEELYTKTWYRKICNLPGLDSNAGKGDSLMPIPGCTQGGYSPSIYCALVTSKLLIT